MSWIVCILFLFCTFNFDKDIPESNKCHKKSAIAASSCLKASLEGPPLYVLKGVFLPARHKEHIHSTSEIKLDIAW